MPNQIAIVHSRKRARFPAYNICRISGKSVTAALSCFSIVAIRSNREHVMGEPVRALLVTADSGLHASLEALLADSGEPPIVLELATDYDSDSALQALEDLRHDVWLIDQRLGARIGLDLVSEPLAAAARPAVLMLLEDEQAVVELEGTALEITGVLIKQHIDASSLRGSIRHAIAHHRAVAALAASEQRHAFAARALDDGLWDWDLVSGEMFLSARFNEIVGRSGEATSDDGSVYFKLVHGDDLIRVRSAIDAHLAGRTPVFECEHRILGDDGGWRAVATRGLAIRRHGGDPVRMVGWVSELDRRRAAGSEVRAAALRDPLTGLPNKELLLDRLEHVARRAGRDPELGCALMLLDVDRFTVIREYVGDAVAEELLRAIARRLERALRPGDTVARTKGDEFALLLEGVRDREEALVISDRLWAAITPRFSLRGHELPITVSIGGALAYPGMSPAALVSQARVALEEAKAHGGERFALFEEGMRRQAPDGDMRRRLAELIDRDLVDVSYQPIVHLATGTIHGFEALVRWPEDDGGVTPADLIVMAREERLICELGLQVLRKALGALSRWRQAGLVPEGASMSVNVSADELEDPQFPARVRAAICGAALPPHLVRLELRENAVMHDPERVAAVAAEVCASGVALQLDDFGTGYCALGDLHRLPLEGLKIDRSFVSLLDGSSRSGEAVVRSALALGRSLGLHVIAEGIEHPVQLAQLRRLGCRLGQGYAFCRPVSGEAIPSLLAGWDPAEVAASVADGTSQA